jgi:hypothetical protein
MKLITKTLSRKLPPLGSQDGKGMDATAFVKIFTPDSRWTWYITEMDPESGECFGKVCGLETELGYFTIGELEAIRGPLGLPVERDRFFDPTPLKLCN